MFQRKLVATAIVLGLMTSASYAQDKTFYQANDPWWADGQAMLKKRLSVRPIDVPAKNVILFVSDGMGPTTVTASRIFDGQSKGMQGEENVLFFETLPHVAYSKTYNTNAQTPDSAGTASAMMTGVKTKAGVSGVTSKILKGNCDLALANPAKTIGELTELAGMATGVVTTARLTHATPMSVYAHTPHRNWEDDSKVPDDAKGKCKDIAAQLIDFPYGDGIDVAMGGGRRHFILKTDADPEDEGKTGNRKDGRNLINEWKAKSNNNVVVQNQAEFDAIDVSSNPKVLGLFNRSHMEYEADRAKDTGGEPSIAEMTKKAIEILSQNENGYFLMVESGRVDHASHASNAYRTLTDAQAFDDAVEAARKMTNISDTLIIVTADHAHTMSMPGYAQRGNPILGLVIDINKDGTPSDKPALAADGKPYTAITFANGAGSPFNKENTPVVRPDLTDVDTQNIDYMQQSLIPRRSETHGGQDVGIYASGPQAYLFGGVVEQNYIFHVMDYALGLRKRAGVQ